MFNSRELATVLAALRYWQRTTTHLQRATDGFPENVIAADAGCPLYDEEIDKLCQRLNGSTVASEPHVPDDLLELLQMLIETYPQRGYGVGEEIDALREYLGIED